MDDGFFWENQERVFVDAGDLADYIHDYCPDIIRKDWPLAVAPAKLEYLKLDCEDRAQHITEWLVEDHLNRLNSDGWHTNCSGESVIEGWLEEYYDCCDWFDGPSSSAEVAISEAESIMQDAINWWMFWNAGLIKALSKYLWWKPWQWCVGITVIEQAIEKAETALRGIDVYLVASNDTVKVDYPYS